MPIEIWPKVSLGAVFGGFYSRPVKADPLSADAGTRHGDWLSDRSMASRANLNFPLLNHKTNGLCQWNASIDIADEPKKY